MNLAKLKTKPKTKCKDCGKELSRRDAKRCRICYGKIQSQRLLKLWKDNNFRNTRIASMLNHFVSETTKEKLRNICIKMRKEGKFNIKPNKSEIILQILLNKLFNKKYKYAGDGKIWIGKKNPDFINKKEKKIIELFGKYWHTGNRINCYADTQKGRIQYFKKFNYKTIIVWEKELKNINKLIRKLLRFNQC